MFDFWATQSKTKPALGLLSRWNSPRGLKTVLNVAARFSSELRWSVATGMWVLGVQNPVDLIREMRGYSLRETAGLIRQPTLILHGANDHFSPREQLDMLSAALKAPNVVRVFTEEEGAEEHCQMGNMTLLHQVLFDWLDETL